MSALLIACPNREKLRSHLFSIAFYYLYVLCCVGICTCVCMCTEDRDIWYPWSWQYSQLWAAWCGSGPFQEQYMFLTSEPPLQNWHLFSHSTGTYEISSLSLEETTNHLFFFIRKYILLTIMFVSVFLTQGLTQLRLALNSWCSWGWLWTTDHLASISQILG